MRGVISPTIQYPAEALKTEESKNSIPIPTGLALILKVNPVAFRSKTIDVGVFWRPVAHTRLRPHGATPAAR